MTLAKRLCTLVLVDDTGRPRKKLEKGGLIADFAEAIASFLAQDGADEIWLRLDPTSSPTGKGANALFAPLSALESRIFLPLVAWAPVQSASDARLLVGFGADRVVVDVNAGGADPLGFVSRIAQTVGADRVVAALSVRRSAGEKGVVWELVDAAGQGMQIDALPLCELLPAAGACEILLVPSVPAPQSDRVVHDGDLIEQVASRLSIPVLSAGEDREPADLAAALLMGADGVVTSLFSGGTPTVAAGKAALAEMGLTVRPVDGA